MTQISPVPIRLRSIFHSQTDDGRRQIWLALTYFWRSHCQRPTARPTDSGDGCIFGHAPKVRRNLGKRGITDEQARTLLRVGGTFYHLLNRCTADIDIWTTLGLHPRFESRVSRKSSMVGEEVSGVAGVDWWSLGRAEGRNFSLSERTRMHSAFLVVSSLQWPPAIGHSGQYFPYFIIVFEAAWYWNNS